MRARAELPAVLGDAFTSTQALQLGWDSGRLKRPDLLHPFHGARARLLKPVDDEVPADAWRRGILHRARAYALVMPDDAFLCLITAAVVFDLPLPAQPGFTDFILDAAVLAPGRAPRGRGIHGHQLARDLGSVVMHDGLRVTSPATTWAMLGGRLSQRDLIAMGDAVVRRGLERMTGHGPARRWTRIGTTQPREHDSRPPELAETGVRRCIPAWVDPYRDHRAP